MGNAVQKEDENLKHNTVCLPPNNLKDATFGMRVLHCVIPQGHTLKQILAPTYWKHNANIVGPFTKIYCDFEDGSRFLMLNVIANDRTWARVEVLLDTKSSAELDDDIAKLQDGASEDYEVCWKGPEHKFSVIRKKDGEYIEKGFKQKTDAQTWLTQFVNTLSK